MYERRTLPQKNTCHTCRRHLHTGINGVIRSITIEAVNSGLNVIGIYDGFEYLSRGDSSHTTGLRIDDVSRIHFDGGSILHTSSQSCKKARKCLKLHSKRITVVR
ncbi:MAG: 6-phosphofructokinase [Ignavibacteria bacterium]|nr:6-phosphofructokinase [Ignavibacteria bacterium]